MGLSLSTIYYSNIYLGFKTTPGSFGEGLGILTPGWGAENPSMHVLQVSNCLDLLDSYFTDIDEVERAHPGLLDVISDPLLRGSKSQKSRLCVTALRGRFALLGT